MKLTAKMVLLMTTLVLGVSYGEKTYAKDTEVIVEKNGVKFTAKRAIEVNEDLSNIEEVKEKLNSFIISAELGQELEGAGIFKCSKIVGGPGSSKSTKIDPFATDASLEMQIREEELRLDINCQILTAKGELSTAKFSFKKSLIISEEVLYQDLLLLKEKENRIVDRLIVTKSGLLLTNGEKISLKVSELYSDDGTIMTFDEGMRKATNLGNRDGQSGGEIVIKANKSYGRLHVVMAGKDGDDQLNRPEEVINDFLDIDVSRNAKDELAGPCPLDRSIKIGNLGGFTPRGGPVSNPCRNWNASRPVSCAKAATPGPRGKDGNPGENGNNGGDSGKMIYSTEEAGSSFEMILTATPGKGGKGAIGSLPTSGGKGGAGSQHCSAARDGESGVKGSDGVIGKAGIALKSCYQNVQKGVDTCK